MDKMSPTSITQELQEAIATLRNIAQQVTNVVREISRLDL